MQPIIGGNYLVNPYLKDFLINKNFISTDMKIKLKENKIKNTNYLSFEIYGNIKHNNSIVNTLSRMSPQLYIGEFIMGNDNDFDNNQDNIINIMAKGLNKVSQKEVYDLKEFIFDAMSQIANGEDVKIETENIIEYIIHIVDSVVDLSTELVGITDETIEHSIKELEEELANIKDKEYNDNNDNVDNEEYISSLLKESSKNVEEKEPFDVNHNDEKSISDDNEKEKHETKENINDEGRKQQSNVDETSKDDQKNKDNKNREEE